MQDIFYKKEEAQIDQALANELAQAPKQDPFLPDLVPKEYEGAKAEALKEMDDEAEQIQLGKSRKTKKVIRKVVRRRKKNAEEDEEEVV